MKKFLKQISARWRFHVNFRTDFSQLSARGAVGIVDMEPPSKGNHDAYLLIATVLATKLRFKNRTGS
jgi:hypothetical protein